VKLDDSHYVRQKLFAGGKSPFQRYRQLVVGDGSLWTLLRYEILTTLLGPVPGALGLLLRKLFYPALFARTGRGVVFGRSLTLRNCDRIRLGDRVMIDDGALLDGRGSGDEGIEIGAETVIHHRACIQSKVGGVRIGAHSDIGADSSVVAQGPIHIGDMVSLGGGCMVGGGLIDPGDEGAEAEGVASVNDFSARGQRRFSRGPIEIGSRCVFGSHVTVLDGVRVGPGSMIGAGAVLREDVPAGSIAMPHQRIVVAPRSQFGAETAAPKAAAKADAAPAAHRAQVEGAPKTPEERIYALLYQVFDELDAQLPADRRLPRDPEAPLVAPDGPLDSLGLVNLVVATEQRIEEELGRAIDLAGLGAGEDGEQDAARAFASVGAFAGRVAALVAAAE